MHPRLRMAVIDDTFNANKLYVMLCYFMLCYVYDTKLHTFNCVQITANW